jgi:hypothetical protein
MKATPMLQVFCPVDPSELETTPSGIVCRKCQQGLVDVSCPSAKTKLANGVCGVMRRFVGPVVGSTIALSSCSLDGSSSEPDQLTVIKSRADKGPADGSEVPIPGSYFHPGGVPIDPDAYPVAKRTSQPGIVISPYTQSKVDVSNVSAGTLVLDPAYKMTDKKFFRVPSVQQQSE